MEVSGQRAGGGRQTPSSCSAKYKNTKTQNTQKYSNTGTESYIVEVSGLRLGGGRQTVGGQVVAQNERVPHRLDELGRDSSSPKNLD